MSSIKAKLADDIKSAMRAKDSQQLTTLRLVSAAIKQKEVDDRVDLDDPAVLAVIEKMVKQRKDSVEQFRAGGREDLATREESEIAWLADYLPAQLSEAELQAIISEAIATRGATSMKEMGKVMGLIKPRVQGRTDMGALSARIKASLGG